jgi:hypothetical protein
LRAEAIGAIGSRVEGGGDLIFSFKLRVDLVVGTESKASLTLDDQLVSSLRFLVLEKFRMLSEKAFFNLSEFVHVDGSLTISPAHHNIDESALLIELAPPFLDDLVPRLAVHFWVLSLHFGHGFASVKPESRHEPELARRFDSFVVRATKFELMDLLSVLID